MLHKLNNKFFKDDQALSKGCYMIYMHIINHMFKQCLLVLGLKKCIFFNLQYFSRGELPTPKGLFPKYGSLSWKNIRLCIQKNMMCNCGGHILLACIYPVLVIKKQHILKKSISCAAHFWHRSRVRHDLLQGYVLPFEKKCTCWREQSLQRDASLLF